MKSIVLAMALMGVAGIACAEETVTEKMQETGNDMKRGVQKGVNRTKEAVCTDSDAECLAKKAGHRVEEGADSAKDKVKEVKNDIDSDKN